MSTAETLTRQGPEITILVRTPVVVAPIPLYVWECTECHDTGTHGLDPETGQRLWCEHCAKGLNYALAALEPRLQADADWIARADARLKAGQPVDGETYTQATRTFYEECAEHDRLSALYAQIRFEHEPEVHFFEDAI